MKDLEDRVKLPNNEEMLLLVGTYTNDSESKGLYSLAFNERQHTLAVKDTVASNPNPSFIAQFGPMVLAAHEVNNKGRAATYLLNEHGEISHLSTAHDEQAAGTCFVSMHPSGRWVYGANYESGTLSCWPLRLDGRLGPLHATARHTGHGKLKPRQNASHIHSASFLPGSDFLAVVDLGCDVVMIYRASKQEGLRPEPVQVIQTPAGFGPRILAFHPHLNVVALVGELANRVLIYALNNREESKEQTDISHRPATWQLLTERDLPTRAGMRSTAAHAEFSPDGSHLYVSTRGRDVISVLLIDGEGQVTGQYNFSAGGHEPRHFSLSPCGRYLAIANQESDEVVLFSLASTSMPKELCRIDIPQACCVIWSS